MAKEGLFEEFILDCRVGDGSQRYDDGSSTGRRGGDAEAGSCTGDGTAACGSAAVEQSGSNDQGRSISCGEPEVLHGIVAYCGYGQCFFEVIVGL